MNTRIWRIARLEWTQAWRSRTLVILAVVSVLLLSATSIVGLEHLRADDAQRSRYEAIVGSQWREQPDRHPHRVSHYGFLVFRPRGALASLDRGVEAFSGTSIFLEAHRQNSANFSDARHGDAVARFGELTVAAVLQAFTPLVIFILAGSTFTRERESGTLSLLLCQGTPITAIAWGKFIGALAMVAVLVVPGMAVAGAVLAARSPAPLGADDWLRAALLVLAHAAFLAICAALAVIVSMRHRSSRGALLTLVAVWMALWVVVPRVLPTLANTWHPLPSRAAFEAEVERHVRELGDSHNPDDPKFQSLKQEYLAKYGVARVEDLPLNYNGVVMIEGERLTTEAYRAQQDELAGILARQARVLEWAGAISPYLAMRHLSMALAGVDVHHVAEFDAQAERYRYTLVQFLNELHTSEVSFARDRYAGSSASEAPTRQQIDRAHWEDAPPFTFVRPTVGWAVGGQTASVLALAAWTAGTMLLLTLLAPRVAVV